VKERHGQRFRSAHSRDARNERQHDQRDEKPDQRDGQAIGCARGDAPDAPHQEAQQQRHRGGQPEYEQQDVAGVGTVSDEELAAAP
jgi:hypothetical protein